MPHLVVDKTQTHAADPKVIIMHYLRLSRSRENWRISFWTNRVASLINRDTGGVSILPLKVRKYLNFSRWATISSVLTHLVATHLIRNDEEVGR